MITLSNIQVTETGTPTEPVTVSDAKAWIGGLDGVTDFDGLIGTMITGARQDIENYLSLKLVPSTVSLYLDTTKCDEEITVLPYSLYLPSSFTVFNQINKGEDPTAMAVDVDYYLNGTLSFTTGGRYQLGYAVATTVPQTLKEAIKMLVAYRFDNRGDQEKQQGIPEDVISKINSYKQIWL
jgi:uncharacterized phiE125 gp8 family phage protein